MATATAKLNPATAPLAFSNRIVCVNAAPEEFDLASGLPAGFLEFLAPLHAALTLRQRALVARRERALADAHAGKLPNYLPPSVATTNSWRIELPAWCADQRNQMTGPADEAELVVKMLNSGAPGVMLDLEDSNANSWEHTICGIENILDALEGRLTYYDEQHGDFHAAARLTPSPGRHFARRAAAGTALRRSDDRVSSGFQRVEASALFLHSEIG